MATVTFHTPTDTQDLVMTTSRSSYFFSDSVFELIANTEDQYQAITGIGLSTDPATAAIIGTITTAFFDDQDVGYAPNVVISGMNFVLTLSDNFTTVDGRQYTDLLPSFLSGADVLRGSAGADVMSGYAGDDTFFGGGGGDTYDGGADSDTVSYAGASAGLFAGLEDAGFNSGLAAGDSYISIENLIGTSFNDILYGTGAANKFTAGAGNDLMVGKAGGDTLDGGSGNDTVSYDASLLGIRADLLTPSTNTGHAAGDRYVSIENLAGSSFNDRLYGNNSANILQGNTYQTPADIDQDQLFGRGGNDTLRGWDGNDTLEGGTGRDILTGGLGADKFVFKPGHTGKTSSTRDVITDFTHNNTLSLSDRIDLSAIDASTAAGGNQSFNFIAKSAFSGVAGQLRYKLENNPGAGNDRTIIEGDVNGDRVADFQIQLTGLKALVKADFIL